MTEIDRRQSVSWLQVKRSVITDRPSVSVASWTRSRDNGCRAIALVVVYRQRVPFSPIGRESTSKPLPIVIDSFISGQSGVNSTTDIEGMVRK